MILTDYTDKELLPNDAKEISKHIASCDACFNFYNQVQKHTIIPIVHAKSEKMPQHIKRNIKHKIKDIALRQEEQKIIYAKRFFEYACAAALIACIFSFFSLLNKPSYSQTHNTAYGLYLSNNNLTANNSTGLLYLYD